MANKKKLATAAVAVTAAAAMLLSGTFAWQSISQTALNEASDVINPGGRLHDDFNGENKDIYVENFAEEDIYARIRLSEYFEIIANYGKEGIEKSTQILGSKSEDDEGNAVYDYDLFTNYDSLSEGALEAGYDTADDISYWTWQTGGQTVYMPTFNLNKDSLAADINGIYEDGNVGTISDRILDMTDENAQYSEYKEYTDGEALSGTEIYDADANDVEDDGTTTIDGVEHMAKYTETGSLISMDQWNGEAGPYWVYDTDGWVYWAQAIEPDTATGLLLDSIELNQVMDDTWYYAIHVEAQFVTADDVGKSDGTGFFTDGAPTDEAQALLETIGVDMSGEAPDNGGDDETTGDDDEEGDLANGFRIYSHSDDEGTNYSNGKTVTLGEGTYDLFVSYGEGGHYIGENPNSFTWSVNPEGLQYTSSVSEYEANDYYVSIGFTLDESVPEGTYTVIATNDADGITRTAQIVWEGSEASGGGSDTTELPESEDYSILSDSDFMMAENETMTLSVVDGELTSAETNGVTVTWKTNSTDLAITEAGEVSFVGAMTDPLQEYTVTAVLDGTEQTSTVIYVYDPETYDNIGIATSETTGATYYGFDYVPYEGEGRLGLVPTQICVYRAGDNVSDVYYYIETSNYNFVTMGDYFDDAYAKEPIEMPRVSEIDSWPVTG